ncbi:MAG: RtcB family protein [Bacteroidales bacterium]
MNEIHSEKIPIKLWLNSIEDGALKQAKNLANLPFAFRHIALMPDCHEGFGMPIGGVLATRDAVIPNAVGVDIGCGMCAVKTSVTEISIPILKEIMSKIRNVVPLGFNHHPHKQDISLLPSTINLVPGGIVEQEFENARKQIGTLGGGNHFIEIQKGSDNHIWIMIHSGSRNLGLKVADFYNKAAKKICLSMDLKEAVAHDLAYLNVDTPEANNYLAEMQYCIDFALANRSLMMNNIENIFSDYFGSHFERFDFVNIAHNYAREEEHFNQQVIVHRKGATSARQGETGIIPGSQGTKSYIVKGKGNPESFMSCSHGAGRKMGRKQAQRQLILDEEIRNLNKKGIIHAIRTQKDLDEAPGAYKDIDTVMKNQQDLVEIAAELTPLAVIKG